jgi:hypothetical protein
MCLLVSTPLRAYLLLLQLARTSTNAPPPQRQDLSRLKRLHVRGKSQNHVVWSFTHAEENHSLNKDLERIARKFRSKFCSLRSSFSWQFREKRLVATMDMLFLLRLPPASSVVTLTDCGYRQVARMELVKFSWLTVTDITLCIAKFENFFTFLRRLMENGCEI